MYYYKIKKQMGIKRVKRYEAAEYIGLSLHGFDEMIRNETMTVDRLEKISRLFDVPISYWFAEGEEISMVKEPESIYKKRTDEILEILKEENKAQRCQIEFQQSLIEKEK